MSTNKNGSDIFHKPVVMSSRKTSEIWNHYWQVDAHKAKCCYCKQIISVKGGSTGNLSRHIRLKHARIRIFRAVKDNVISQLQRKDRRKESREDVSVKSADIIDIVSDQSLEGAEESSIMDKTGRTTDGQYEDSFKSAMRDSDASTASNVAETKTEFDVFGSSVAAQLKNMPWENALELQLQIQQLITRYRLNLHKESRTNCSKRPPFELVECGEEPNMGYEEQQVPPVRQPRILECTLEKPKVTGRNANRASLEKKRKRKEEKAATQTTNGDVTSHDGNAETLSSVDATQLKKEMQEVRNKRLRVEQQNNDGGGGGSGASGSTSPEQFAEVLIKEEVMLVDASMAKNVFGEEGELPIVEIKQESSIEDEYNPLGTAATMEEN